MRGENTLYLYKGESILKTETHRFFAVWLIDKYFSELPAVCRAAFYVGCMEPDYSAASYLYGFFIRPFYGHDYENRRKWLEKRLKRLDNFSLSPVSLFKLGRLVHFLCDAFTRVHNFPLHGNFSSHARYERVLNSVMRSAVFDDRAEYMLKAGKPSPISEHEKYICDDPSPENDCRYIIPSAVWVIKYALSMEILNNGCKKTYPAKSENG